MEERGQEPVLALWPAMTVRLRQLLLGAYNQHKIVSTRKAIAAFRAVPEIRQLLDSMEERTEVPPSDQDSVPASPEEAAAPPKTFLTSPCVSNTAASFLNEQHGECFQPVTELEFFLRLVRVSGGPTMSQWRKDGYTGDKVRELISEGPTIENKGEERRGLGEAPNEDENMCKICFEIEINSVILECGHSATCLSCSSGLQTCPLCRQPITRVVKLFKA
ncbi:Baculoviral IAP repeat-containing protein 2 [Balamuthia mandrillaris]